MPNTTLALLSDHDLLTETKRAAACERRTTAQLIALLAELDARTLYLGEGCASLFTYCTHVLRVSESAAYSRITAARTARRFPLVLDLLADGVVTLTTLSLLSAHLTEDNHRALLEAARHQSKRDVERQVACLAPRPDVPSSVRKLPAPRSVAGPAPTGVAGPAPVRVEACAATHADAVAAAAFLAPVMTPPPRAHRPVVAPLAPERYLIKITVGRETHQKLQRAQDLLRHAIPSGDPAAVIDRALTVLIERLEKAKLAATPRARATAPTTSTTRHVPAAVKRVVWARDEGRCAFVGGHGRCTETGFLEFHHVTPFAFGGRTDVDNLQLRCRSHNAYEAARDFGDQALLRGIEHVRM